MAAIFAPLPVTLSGDVAVLEPLGLAHVPRLYEAGRHQDDWKFLPRAAFSSLEDCEAWVREGLDAPDSLPFAIVAKELGHAVGSTRFLDVRIADRGLEIGWTWIGHDWQRTALNTECKLLLLRHAFEDLGAIRVQFKTDARNERSQRAIERLGASLEGTLRRNMLVQDGHQRDSVYYSVLDTEWPAVNERLQGFLARKG